MRHAFPRMLPLEQHFPRAVPLDIAATVQRELAPLRARLKPGAKIAVGVGSRGITQLAAIVRATLDVLRAAGTEPFIIPAMGSHGGATPEGQMGLLAEYGITETTMGSPICAAMETAPVGTTEQGATVVASLEARRADGIIVINRIKPHTDFASETLGSGLLKMLVIGLGKRDGASAFHHAASQFGYERTIRSSANILLRTLPVLGGLGIVEDPYHSTARLAFLPAETMEAGEAALFAEAKALMPRLPFDKADLLIIDRLGKNISGAGMDPNVTGRWVHGRSAELSPGTTAATVVRRIFVRDLTPETHGNSNGIGLADITTSRLINGTDKQSTYINALTSLTPHGAKFPIHFDTDAECIERILNTLTAVEPAHAKVIRIIDTLTVGSIEVSESYAGEIANSTRLKAMGPATEMAFDTAGNLLPLRTA